MINWRKLKKQIHHIEGVGFAFKATDEQVEKSDFEIVSVVAKRKSTLMGFLVNMVNDRDNVYWQKEFLL